MLHSVPMTHITTLKRFKEIILEQLGKNVVCFSLEFDVGYIVGSSKICFSQSDDVKTELGKIKKKGYNLWCEGLDVTQKRPLPVSECGGNSIVVVDDSDSEEYTCKPPAKKEKRSAFEERKHILFKPLPRPCRINMVAHSIWYSTNCGLRHYIANNMLVGMSLLKDGPGVMVND